MTVQGFQVGQEDQEVQEYWGLPQSRKRGVSKQHTSWMFSWAAYSHLQNKKQVFALSWEQASWLFQFITIKIWLSGQTYRLSLVLRLQVNYDHAWVIDF